MENLTMPEKEKKLEHNSKSANSAEKPADAMNAVDRSEKMDQASDDLEKQLIRLGLKYKAKKT